MQQATTEPPLRAPKRKLKWWHVVLMVIAGLFVVGVITEAMVSRPKYRRDGLQFVLKQLYCLGDQYHERQC